MSELLFAAGLTVGGAYILHTYFSRKEKVGDLYTGTEFNKFHKNNSFYKITDERRRFYSYSDGINITRYIFDSESGGFHFVDKKHVLDFMDDGINIRKVRIPDDAYVYVDREGLYRADKVILGPKKLFHESDLWNDSEKFRSAVFRHEYYKNMPVFER